MNNSQNSNQNPIPPPPPLPNPLPLPNANRNQNLNMETNRIFDQAERIMKSLQTPQAVRELQPFDGNPVKLHSFLRSVDHLMPFIEPLKNSPFEKIWLQAIRAKIINEADQVLETYGTALDRDEMKANLISYYNDKLDPVTLTRELFQIQQIDSVEQFFGNIQNLLSLLINHTNISTDNDCVKQDRIRTHKENALQVFLAGIKEGDRRPADMAEIIEKRDKIYDETTRNLKRKQEKDLELHNKNKESDPTLQPDETIYIARQGIKSKVRDKYRQHRVRRDRNKTFIDDQGRKIHKTKIRRQRR
jgi:hypothetical protein